MLRFRKTSTKIFVTRSNFNFSTRSYRLQVTEGQKRRRTLGRRFFFKYTRVDSSLSSRALALRLGLTSLTTFASVETIAADAMRSGVSGTPACA